MRCLLLACLLAGCAGAGGNHGGNDLGPANGICPAHPDQCGGKCCGATCTEVMADRNHCGDCNAACPTGQVCLGGGCGCPAGGGIPTVCSNGQSCCGLLGCKSLMNDDFHCGDCTTACSGGAHCSGGKCLCGGVACTGSSVCCGGACSSACAMPDMASSGADMAGGGNACQCASHCPLSQLCLGPNCCFEDVYFFRTCMAAPPSTCSPNQMP